ncbi:hypothetical protein DMENIID0001_087960 [Sergentomyia squamirostris]
MITAYKKEKEYNESTKPISRIYRFYLATATFIGVFGALMEVYKNKFKKREGWTDWFRRHGSEAAKGAQDAAKGVQGAAGTVAAHTKNGVVVEKLCKSDDNLIKPDTNTLKECLEETPKDFVPKRSLNPTTWLKIYYRRITGIYSEVSGANEVHQAFEKVDKIRSLLTTIRRDRRKIAQDLLEIRKNLQTVNNDISASHLEDPDYLQLVRKRIEILQAELAKEAQFRHADCQEREQFSQLVDSMITAYDKEKVHNESTRYFSRIYRFLLGTATFIGVFGPFKEMYKQKFKKKEGWTDWFWRHGSGAAQGAQGAAGSLAGHTKNGVVGTWNWSNKQITVPTVISGQNRRNSRKEKSHN